MTEPQLWLEAVNKLGLLLIAAVSATYAWRQYRNTKEWKRIDAGAAALRQLREDEDLVLACQALDWGVGPLFVPVRYKPLLKETGTPDVVAHSPELLGRAMVPQLSFNPASEPAALMYRQCFDHLFTYLDNVYRQVEADAVILRDIRELKYYLEQICTYPYAIGPKPDEVFQPFLAAFGYDGVVALGRRFGIEGWQCYDAAQKKPS
jgi:hypothetical protein